VIIANSTLSLAAVHNETRTIPIVFVLVGDPVGQGFVTSLAHPGGNINPRVPMAALFAASRASAADLPVRTGPAPAYYPVSAVYDWGGAYVGINGGYAFGQSQWSDPFNPSGLSHTGHFSVNGGLVGATMGVSGQWGAWVFGVEGDFDWQGLSGTSSSTSPFCTKSLRRPPSDQPPPD
jgi:hypothetical protein